MKIYRNRRAAAVDRASTSLVHWCLVRRFRRSWVQIVGRGWQTSIQRSPLAIGERSFRKLPGPALVNFPRSKRLAPFAMLRSARGRHGTVTDQAEDSPALEPTPMSDIRTAK